MNRKRINVLTKSALLAALAAVIMYIDFPLPFLPAFLKLDFSDIPALIGAFAYGPLVGVMIEFVKNVAHLPVDAGQTGGVGSLANFIIGSAFVIPVGVLYKARKDRKGAFLGLLIGGISMVLFACIANYFVLIPIYERFMPLDKIIAFAAASNPLIKSVNTYILYGVIPFNALKVLVVSVVTLVLYKKVSPILHK
ncbi:MAG: ECF transporter S component [Hyphomonadaceae bacterium]|nr:ECF transporter S component [Clostridia bacterium]